MVEPSVFTISNLRPDQTGSLLCSVQRDGVGVGTPRTVRFGVASPPDTSSTTEATEENSIRRADSRSSKSTTTNYMVCVFNTTGTTSPSTSHA